MSTESVMPSNHLILSHPLLILPSIFPSNVVFSNESALSSRWPKYWFHLSEETWSSQNYKDSKCNDGTSLVVWWLRICLPVQRFDPWCSKISHAVEQLSLRTTTTEPVLRNKQSHRSENPEHRNQRAALGCRNWRKPANSKEHLA